MQNHPRKGVSGSPPDLGSGHLVGSNPTSRTKVCGICKLEKPASEFHKRGKGLNPWCKVCRKSYDANYWQENSKKRRQQVKELKDKTWKWLQDYKSGLACSVEGCSENHPAALDFHHRNPKEKSYAVGQLIQKGWSQERILTEIEKCDVMCSNCHRKHHWKEKY